MGGLNKGGRGRAAKRLPGSEPDLWVNQPCPVDPQLPLGESCPEATAHQERGIAATPSRNLLASVGFPLSTPMLGRKEPADLLNQCLHLTCAAQDAF